MKNLEAEKVQPTYVLFYPYIKQNNKVEFLAKYGSLFFSVSSVICMILFYLNSKDHFWVLYLPQFVFYSLVYLFGRNSDNKTFQLIQIVATYILADYTYYLSCFTGANKFTYGLDNLTFGICAIMLLYAIAVKVLHRKQYVKDLTTLDSVYTLNRVDLLYILSFLVNAVLATALTQLLKSVFPFFIYYQPRKEVPAFILFTFRHYEVFALFALACVTGPPIFFYCQVNRWNHTKKLASVNDVIFDETGRAWYCSCSDDPKAKKLTWWKRSGVKPENSQKLPLKSIV